MANDLVDPPRFEGSVENILKAIERWLVHVWNWGRRLKTDTEAASAANTDRIAALEGIVGNVEALTALSQTITNPPTQAEVQAIQAKVNELVTTVNALAADADAAGL